MTFHDFSTFSDPSREVSSCEVVPKFLSPKGKLFTTWGYHNVINNFFDFHWANPQEPKVHCCHQQFHILHGKLCHQQWPVTRSGPAPKWDLLGQTAHPERRFHSDSPISIGIILSFLPNKHLNESSNIRQPSSYDITSSNIFPDFQWFRFKRSIFNRQPFPTRKPSAENQSKHPNEFTELSSFKGSMISSQYQVL